MGRVGVITHRERHDGGFNIVHLKDAVDNEFATRESNVFVIGHEKPWISLPKGKGVKVCVDVSKEFMNRRELTNVALDCRRERPPSGACFGWALVYGGVLGMIIFLHFRICCRLSLFHLKEIEHLH